MATKAKAQQAKKATAADAIAQVNAARGVAAEHIGDIMWWDANGGWHMPVADVEAVFAKHGLNPKTDLPDSPDWGCAFGRAIRRMTTDLNGRDYKLIDAAPGAGGERRVGIVKVQRNGRVTTEDKGTIACPTTGAAAFVEREDPSGIAGELLALARTLVDVYSVEDVRSSVTRILERSGAMPCRKAPPHMVYWVPPTAAAIMRQLADAVEELGWGRIELFAGYANDPRSTRAAVRSVNQGLEEQLSEFAAAADEFTTTAKKTMPTTITRKLEQVKELREKAQFFKTMLGAAVVSIDERVAKVETSLRSTLGVVEAKIEAKRATA